MNDYRVDFSLSKPKGLTDKHASVFKDKSVSDAYKHRPPYSPELLDELKRISPPNPRILDIGCGCGDLTLLLANISDNVDAVDFSKNMINEAQKRPNSEVVNWYVGKVEEQPLTGHYDLITSAQSLHWMEWEIVFPKLKSLLKPSGFFVIVDRTYANSE